MRACAVHALLGAARGVPTQCSAYCKPCAHGRHCGKAGARRPRDRCMHVCQGRHCIHVAYSAARHQHAIPCSPCARRAGTADGMHSPLRSTERTGTCHALMPHMQELRMREMSLLLTGTAVRAQSRTTKCDNETLSTTNTPPLPCKACHLPPVRAMPVHLPASPRMRMRRPAARHRACGCSAPWQDKTQGAKEAQLLSTAGRQRGRAARYCTRTATHA